MIPNTKDRRGFTLLELLIVIAIIGILVAMGTVSYSTAQKRARDSKRQGDMKAIQNAFEQYYAVHNGSYPYPCPVSGQTLAIEEGNNFVIPTDPRNTSPYPSDTSPYVYKPSGCDSSASSYCYCAHLETSGQGNSGVDCNFNATTKDYFCVKNLQ